MNHPLALYGLGVYYDKGELLPEDKEKTIHFFKESANLQNPQSNFIYGIMLYYGAEGININTNEAFGRLEYAISMGMKEAEEFIKFINEVEE